MRFSGWRLAFHGLCLSLLAALFSGCGSNKSDPVFDFDFSKVTVFAFSQANSTSGDDPQILDLRPDINIRAWQRWDTNGTKPGDYNFNYTSRCQDAGIIFVAGTTASAYYREEAVSDAEYRDMVSKNASNGIVLHDAQLPGLRRASLANPAYRDYLVGIARIQIDGGVNGLFFDEVNGGYGGMYGDGNEGFDDYHLADFNAYLIAKYPNYTEADWQTRFGMAPDNIIHPDLSPKDLTNNFNYRHYLADKGWSNNPFTAGNPLADEWGRTVINRPNPNTDTFLDQYVLKVYWKDIVDRVRAYAASKGRKVLITSNGLFPYVDFQGYGLYDYNRNGENGEEIDYTPVSGGHLNGSVSLLSHFMGIKARSRDIAGDVPVVLFIDWPSNNMDRYNNLPPTERQDYWRMYAAEAYAAGIYFAFHLHTATGEPTATQAGVMPLFKQLTAFYQAHADLFHEAVDTRTPVSVSASNIACNLRAKNGQNRLILHLINHNYSAGFLPVNDFTVQFPAAHAPSSVKLVSPDLNSEEDVPFTYANGNVLLNIRTLIAYNILVIDGDSGLRSDNKKGKNKHKRESQ